MHGDDAALPGIDRISQHHWSTVQCQTSTVGLQDSGEHIDQGALASTVFSDQRMYFSRLQLKRDIVQRHDTREGSPEPVQPQ